MLLQSLSKDARCIFRRVQHDVLLRARADGLWTLATTGDDRRVWERLYQGDHVVLLSIHAKQFLLLAAEVVGKSLDLGVPKSEKPLLLSLKVHGTGIPKVLPLHPYGIRDDLFCLPGDLAALWEICEACSVETKNQPDIHFFELHGIRVRVASTLRDLQFITSFAKSHAFGYRTAFLTLIGIDGETPVGAILVQPCLSTRYPHQATLRVFGADYAHFRHDSLSIKRIYTGEKCRHRNELHETLLRALIEIAPFMVEGTLRIIEAVSYDFHPVAVRIGFLPELPETPFGSIYYWKPLGLPGSYVSSRSPNIDDVKAAAHALSVSRADIRFYGIFSRYQDIGRSERLKAWMLVDSAENKGVWRTLRQGDLLFYVRDKHIVEGYGIVAGTSFDSSSRQYPLRIDFSHVELPYIALDLASEPFSDFVAIPERGGIFAIARLEGSDLKQAVDSRYSEGRMWVYPNPYLLSDHNTAPIPNYVFVVQAFALKETVLPVLRTMLAEAGFSVTHADDRQGQVIFDDIWKLLLECEVVLVDFTEKRPNVYLEYGMALVLGRPIVAITQDIKDVPTDTPQLKVIKYENTMTGTSELKLRLLKAMQDRQAESRKAQLRARPDPK